MASQKRIALTGFGFMGSMHAQVYGQLPDAQLIAVADANPAAARAKLEHLKIAVPVYPTLGELLKSHPEADAVDVCTPLDCHEADALLALDAGKHLFCEKPLAPSLEAADRILARAVATKAIAQVGHCIRFWPEYQALRAFFNGNAAGKLLSLCLTRRGGRPTYSDGDWLNQAGRSGGAALDLHIHDTDFVLALLGRPSAVTSRATFDYSGPSHIFTLYDYPGVAVQAEGGWNYPAQWGFKMIFQALFERACVDFDSSRDPTLAITWQDRAPEPMPFAAPRSGNSAGGEGNISNLGGYFNELESFVACLVAGRPPKDATLADARASLGVALAEIESARTGKTINL
jgi:predicted dehydrogenase